MPELEEYTPSVEVFDEQTAPLMNDASPEPEVEVIEEASPESEIEIVEGEEEATREPIDEAAVAAAESEDIDVESIKNPRLKSRIQRLTYLRRETERQRDDISADFQNAVSYSQNAKIIADELSKRLAEAQAFAKQQVELRNAAQAELAKTRFAAARSTENVSEEATANQEVARLEAERAQWRGYQPPAPYVMPEFRQRQPTAADITPETREWIGENQWFSSDPAMRAYAITLEGELSKNGYVRGSKACYDAIDAVIQKNFPDRFKQGAPPAKPASPARTTVPVASVSRTSAATNGSAKLRLVATASDRRTAEAFGVPLADYLRSKHLFDKGKI